MSSFPCQISVVVPLYNEEESLPELIAWIAKVMDANQYTYEVILVNDGSQDNSWAVIKRLVGQFPSVKGVCFNRNYGKSAALNIGFKAAQGEVVITMDADLQDSPDEIPALYRMISEEGYHLVSGWKQKRFDPLSKTIPTKLFNGVTRYLTGIKLHDFNCGLKAYQNRVIKSVDVYGEMHRYIPVLSKWAGFGKIGEKVVQHQSRKYGVTKFGLERFLYGFLDLMSLMLVTRFKKRPMHFFGTMGVMSFLVGFLIAVYLLADKVIHSAMNIRVREVTAQPLFFLALVAIILGSQLFLAGFLGELIANAQRKNEYLIAEELGLELQLDG